MNNEQNIILYDGVCKLCNGWSQFILRFDKQEIYKLCSVQSPAGQQLLRENGYPMDYFETMLVIHKGEIYEKSDAFLCVMRALPRPWRWLVIFQFVPMRIRDWLYDRIALNRYRLFGRYNQCRLPEPNQMHRFL